MNDRTETDRPTVVVAFDFGLSRIGTALGTTLSGTASALPTLAAHDGVPDTGELSALLHEWQPEALVVGLPTHSDGTESEMTQRVRVFGAWLSETTQLPVHYVDERFTSAEAESILREQRRSGVRKRRVRKGEVDAIAATLIAQSWLDSG